MQRIRTFYPQLKLWYIFARLFLAGLNRWPSCQGWGVTLDWPFGNYAKQHRWIIPFLNKHLKDTHHICGPVYAAGGALVVYIWPKTDPKKAEGAKKSTDSDGGLDLEPAQANAEPAIS